MSWEATGIEPSRWASDQARSRGLDVHAGTLEDYDPHGRTFDAVALWDVLEHLTDPVAALRPRRPASCARRDSRLYHGQHRRCGSSALPRAMALVHAHALALLHLPEPSGVGATGRLHTPQGDHPTQSSQAGIHPRAGARPVRPSGEGGWLDGGAARTCTLPGEGELGRHSSRCGAEGVIS